MYESQVTGKPYRTKMSAVAATYFDVVKAERKEGNINLAFAMTLGAPIGLPIAYFVSDKFLKKS